MVSVSGVDEDGHPFVQTAYAHDVSSFGARLEGLALLKSPGQTIDIDHRGRRGKFIVVWVGEPGRREHGHVGIRSLDPTQDIWKIDLPRTGVDNYKGATPDLRQSAPSPALPSAAPTRSSSQPQERRRRRRYPCLDMKAEFRAPGAKVGISGKLTDISLTGCYIEVLTPCLQGTAVDVVLNYQGSVVQLPGRVVAVHPGMGMGIEFNQPSAQSSAPLAALIEAIRVQQS